MKHAPAYDEGTLGLECAIPAILERPRAAPGSGWTARLARNIARLRRLATRRTLSRAQRR